MNESLYGVKYGKSSGTVFSSLGKGSSDGSGAKPTVMQYSDAEEQGDYQRWSDSDDWAVVAREKIEASTTAYPLIAQKVGLMFGRGVYYYKEIRTADGITLDYSPDSKVDDFFTRNDIDKIVSERLMDFKVTGNLFCEFITNNAVNEITRFNHLDSEFCRFGKVHDKTKLITEILYKSRWDKSDDPVVIPFVNDDEYNAETILNRAKSKKKFAIHSCLPSPGRTLYAFPPHGAMFRKNGWLDFANGIPQLMAAINANGMLLKYHVEIPVSYWSWKYPEWDTLKTDEKRAKIDDEFDTMDKFLKGTDNAGSTFFSHFAVDPVTGKAMDGWKITALDDKIKKDQFLTSIQEADAQIARAIGIDSSMTGIQSQSGGMGAGSGSDKRVGFSNTLNISYLEQFVILEPLRIVQRFNRWDSNIRFAFKHDIPTTLNENKQGVKSDI